MVISVMVVSYIIILGVLLGAAVAPVIVAWKRARFMQIVVGTWIWVFLIALLIDLAGPILAKLLGEQGRYRPPEVPISLAMAFGGWVYGLAVAGVVALCRRLGH